MGEFWLLCSFIDFYASIFCAALRGLLDSIPARAELHPGLIIRLSQGRHRDKSPSVELGGAKSPPTCVLGLWNEAGERDEKPILGVFLLQTGCDVFLQFFFPMHQIK